MDPQLLIAYFQAEGYTLIEDQEYDQITLDVNFLFEKDNVLKAVVIRETSDNIPDGLVLRFSESKRIPEKTLEIYFSFSTKPSPKVLSSCKLFGVGILYNSEKGIQIYAESKKIKGRKIIAAIPKTQIFFSSRQHAPERAEAHAIINDQRDSLNVPIFSMLVENDQQYSNDVDKLWPVICKCMDDCPYILVILSGEYREIIDRETLRALDYYDPEEILCYIQKDKFTQESWAALIAKLSAHKVRYIDYIDVRDFKLKFNQRLMRIIIKLHNDNGVQFLAGEV